MYKPLGHFNGNTAALRMHSMQEQSKVGSVGVKVLNNTLLSYFVNNNKTSGEN